MKKIILRSLTFVIFLYSTVFSNEKTINSDCECTKWRIEKIDDNDVTEVYYVFNQYDELIKISKSEIIICEKCNELDRYYVSRSPRETIIKQIFDWAILSTLENSIEINVHDTSFTCGDYEINKEHAFLYVNGINCKREDVYSIGKRMAEILNCRVTCVYNKNDGFHGDILRCIGEKLNITTNSILNLKNQIRHHINIGVEQINIFCHSEGALITDRALRKLSIKERSIINVYAFAPCEIISQYLANKVNHYISARDPVSLFSIKTIDQLNAKNANIKYLQASPGEIFDHSIFNYSYYKKLKKVLANI